MIELVDTHCHIHEISDNPHPDDLVQSKWANAGISSPAEVIEQAVSSGIKHMMLIGCTLRDSKRAIEVAAAHQSCSASIGIHPHEAKHHLAVDIKSDFTDLVTLPEVKAIGECGLDYFYEHSPKKDQFKVLEFQLDLAAKHKLPVSLHVREAYDDFWPIFDNFPSLKGVLHSYTDSLDNMEKALGRGLYFGLNGIMTFTKDSGQLEVAKAIPLKNLLLETDAPFLTPVPFRGKICQPKHVLCTAEFLSDLRGEPLEELAAATSANAKELFGVI